MDSIIFLFLQILFGILYIVNLAILLLIYLKTDVVRKFLPVLRLQIPSSSTFVIVCCFLKCPVASMVGSFLAVSLKESALNLCASPIQ